MRSQPLQTKSAPDSGRMAGNPEVIDLFSWINTYKSAVTAEVASSRLVVPAIHSKRVARISMKPTRVQKGAFLYPFSSIRAVFRSTQERLGLPDDKVMVNIDREFKI